MLRIILFICLVTFSTFDLNGLNRLRPHANRFETRKMSNFHLLEKNIPTYYTQKYQHIKIHKSDGTTLISHDRGGTFKVLSNKSDELIKNDEQTKVYPNPVKDFLKLKIQSADLISVEILNSSGNSFKIPFSLVRMSNDEISFDTKHYSSGAYTGIIRYKNGSFSSFRFVKL